jgi:putative ABC transport system ATP-binding protein
MSENTILHADNLYKTYGSDESAVTALSGVSLEIRDGELLVILGSSGSGKSTLLNMLGGMDRPDEGTVTYRGEDIFKDGDKSMTAYRRNHIGFVFQSFNLIAELTALENVRLTAVRPEAAEEALMQVGLGDRMNAYPGKFSGGQQQRISIARALAKETDILLCDEPTGALDYETGKQILELLEKLCRQQHKTIVIVTHTQEISRMADRVIRMRSGKITGITDNEEPASAKDIEW